MGNTIKRFMESHPSFFAFGLCGISGVFIDADHVIACILGWGNEHGRFLHIPLLIVCGMCICLICAFVGGLLMRVVLKSKVENLRQSESVE